MSDAKQAQLDAAVTTLLAVEAWLELVAEVSAYEGLQAWRLKELEKVLDGREWRQTPGGGA